MMLRTQGSIQRRLGVHRRASSDVVRSARARGCLGRHSGVWSVGGNFLPGASSARTPWVGWKLTPSEATATHSISSLQDDTASCHGARLARGGLPQAASLPSLARTDDATRGTGEWVV